MTGRYTLNFYTVKAFLNFLDKYGLPYSLNKYGMVDVPTQDGALTTWEQMQKLHVDKSFKGRQDSYETPCIRVKILPNQTFIEGLLAY